MKNSFLAVSIILMISCSTERNPDYRLPPPADLISEDKMVTIILEARIKEAWLNEAGIKYDSAQKLFEYIYEPEILKNNQVADTTFLKSYQYYLSDPDLMKDIYGRVIDSLNIKQKLSQVN
ncbi:MAG: DUF4296 domain-containing protein [Bacteroidota bacterium]